MKTLNIITATIFTLTSLFASAQNGVYIANGTNVFFADSATAVSNLENNGNVTIATKAVVNFEGQKWSNGTTAQINGNGTVRFNGTQAQQIEGGYNAAIRTGASFGTLQIDNNNGVQLVNGNARANNVEFKSGVVSVNDNILVVSSNIAGYNANSFVNINNKDGYLLRENISSNNGIVVFPVGTSNGYTPASIRSKVATADNFYVNVVNGVSVDADRSVNRTWNIGKQFNANQDSVEIFLTHLDKEESAFFSNHEARSYVAQFVGGNWDEDFKKVMSVNNTNNRTFNGTIGSLSSFTVLAAKYNVPSNRPVVVPAPSTPELKVNIWPNPTTGLFHVSVNNPSVKAIAVWNIAGVRMAQKAVNGNVVDFAGFTPGTYVVGFIGNNGNVIESRKVIVAGY